MSKGKIKEYNPAHGEGIIIDSETNCCLVVYANSVSMKQGQFLREGMDVEYEIAHDRSRDQAVNVRAMS